MLETNQIERALLIFRYAEYDQAIIQLKNAIEKHPDFREQLKTQLEGLIQQSPEDQLSTLMAVTNNEGVAQYPFTETLNEAEQAAALFEMIYVQAYLDSEGFQKEILKLINPTTATLL